MAEELQSLKDIFRERGRDAVSTELQSYAQKRLRALSKAADLPQKVSGRYLPTEELRQNLLEHVLAPTQVGLGCGGLLVGQGIPVRKNVRKNARKNVRQNVRRYGRKNVRRYVRKNARKNVRRYVRKNVRRYARKNVRLNVRRYARKNVRNNVRRYVRNNVKTYVRKNVRRLPPVSL